MKSIDLNCDLGEGYANDAALMEFISSANIACGGHAGDRATMRCTAELATAAGVAVGAHPGYPDKSNFGRAAKVCSPSDVREIVWGQVLTMADVCGELGIRLCHVKPHGALYNQAAIDEEMAAAIVEGVKAADPSLMIYGLAGSLLIEAAEAAGLVGISEVFADRTYYDDGTLTPRDHDDPFVNDPDVAVERVLRMAREGTVAAVSGRVISLTAETVCIHGDGPDAVEFARRINARLRGEGIDITAPRGV